MMYKLMMIKRCNGMEILNWLNEFEILAGVD